MNAGEWTTPAPVSTASQLMKTVFAGQDNECRAAASYLDKNKLVGRRIRGEVRLKVDLCESVLSS